jgi:hypothetical protein
MTAPYRDDFDALSARHASLTEDLSAIRARTREMADLQQQEGRLAGEIAVLQQKLDGMSSRRSLPLLENLRIASPCTASWDEMTGDERVRFCGHCEKDVYNLSGMAREESERLLRERAGDICVRLCKRHDGTVLTADCPVGVKRKRRRQIAAATVAAVGSGLAAAGALLYQATRPPEVTMGTMEQAYPEVLMGAVAESPHPEPSTVDPAPAPPPEATPPPKTAPSPKPTVTPPTRPLMGRVVLHPPAGKPPRSSR